MRPVQIYRLQTDRIVRKHLLAYKHTLILLTCNSYLATDLLAYLIKLYSQNTGVLYLFRGAIILKIQQ